MANAQCAKTMRPYSSSWLRLKQEKVRSNSMLTAGGKVISREEQGPHASGLSYAPGRIVHRQVVSLVGVIKIDLEMAKSRGVSKLA